MVSPQTPNLLSLEPKDDLKTQLLGLLTSMVVIWLAPLDKYTNSRCLSKAIWFA